MSSSEPSPLPELDWRASVSVREDLELARLVASRLPAPGGRRSVSVTDLLSLRTAFWRATGPPVPSSPEREARLEGGRRIHRELGVVFAATGELEVRVRRAGVHGRVDVLADRPIEVKTSTSPLPSEDLLRARPDHVDQLAMYCTLLERDEGRLIYLHSDGERANGAAVYDLQFHTLPALQQEMGARADQLRVAVRERRATGLPRCPWFGRGCEWQTGGICDCTGSEASVEALATTHLTAISPRTDLARALEGDLAAQTPAAGPPVIELFRDLIYPRRAFFRRALPPPPVLSTTPSRGEEYDLYRRITEAVESGPIGEVARLPTRSDEPDEEVGGFRGEPYLVRTSRARARPALSEWLARSPQYALDLGFRCVATGRRTGRVILGYETAGTDAERVQVLEMTFEPPTTFSRLWRQRADVLDSARRTDDPGRLPACPGWMYAGCDYREVCGCGSTSGRPQWKMTVDAVRRNPSVS